MNEAYVEYFELVPGAQLVTAEYRAQSGGGHVEELLVAGDLGELVVDELEDGLAQLRQLVGVGDGVMEDGVVGVAVVDHVAHALSDHLAQTQLVRTRHNLPPPSTPLSIPS